MYIEFNPIDSLLFRNSKSFDMSFDFFAEGYPLPPLTTVHGALGALYYQENREELDQAGTADDMTRQIKVEGLFYHVTDIVEDKDLGYFVISPADLFPRDETRGDWVDVETAPLLHHKDAVTSAEIAGRRINHFLSPRYEGKGISGVSLLHVDALKRYLSGETDFRVLKLSSAVTPELKIGIKINRKTFSVEQSHFYSILFNRYESSRYRIKFIVKIAVPSEVDGDKIFRGHIRLGGEGRYVDVKSHTKVQKLDEVYQYPSKVEEHTFKKMYFLTPGCFSTPHGDEKTVSIIHNKCIGMVIKGHEFISGFDMVRRKPKPQYRAIPSGSVLYFSAGDDLSEHHGRQISSWEEHYGYNTVLTGYHRSE